MKRRLMIARALMHEPKLLILDEPTAGVDIELRRSMWGFLKDLNDKGTTIILTTHYLEEAEMLCRNIGIIQNGELVENTSMKSLLAKLKSKPSFLTWRRKARCRRWKAITIVWWIPQRWKWKCCASRHQQRVLTTERAGCSGIKYA